MMGPDDGSTDAVRKSVRTGSIPRSTPLSLPYSVLSHRYAASNGGRSLSFKGILRARPQRYPLPYSLPL